MEAKTENHPSYKGSIEIEGRRFWLSGWRREGDDGPWLSLNVETSDPPAEQAKPAMAGAPTQEPKPRTYAARRDDPFL